MASYVRISYRGSEVPNLYQRGERFYVRVSIEKKQTWVPLRATGIQDAVRERDLYFTKPLTERVATNTRVRELWDAVIEYQDSTNCPEPERWRERTRELYVGRYEKFIRPIIGEMRVAEVTARDINRVLDNARGMKHERGGKQVGYSEATIQGVWVILSRLFKYGQEVRFGPCVGALPLNGATKPHPPKGNDVLAEDILSGEDCELLVSQMSPRFKMLYQLAEATGARLSELGGLLWTGVDLEKGRIILRHQLRMGLTEEMKFDRKIGAPIEMSDWLVPLKGKIEVAHSQARVVPISPRMVALLKAYREHLMSKGLYRKDGFVFSARKHGPLSQRNIARALDVEAAKYRIERTVNGETAPKPIHPHAFRHSFASRTYSSGTPLETVSRWLGHSSVDVTRTRYAKVIESLTSREVEQAHLEAAGL